MVHLAKQAPCLCRTGISWHLFRDEMRSSGLPRPRNLRMSGKVQCRNTCVRFLQTTTFLFVRSVLILLPLSLEAAVVSDVAERSKPAPFAGVEIVRQCAPSSMRCAPTCLRLRPLLFPRAAQRVTQPSPGQMLSHLWALVNKFAWVQSEQ